MAWHRPGDKPLSEPMMVCLLTHICVTRPQWVKTNADLSSTELSERIQLRFINTYTCSIQPFCEAPFAYYSDIMINAMASHFTVVPIVYRLFRRRSMETSNRKMFSFDDVWTSAAFIVNWAIKNKIPLVCQDTLTSGQQQETNHRPAWLVRCQGNTPMTSQRASNMQSVSRSCHPIIHFSSTRGLFRTETPWIWGQPGPRATVDILRYPLGYVWNGRRRRHRINHHW